MKILITGGAGYTGVPLCTALLDAGHHVTVVDNFLFGYEPILHIVSHPRLEIVRRDIRDDDISYLKDKDVVFHLAALSGYLPCEANPNSARLINVQASKNLVEALAPSQLLVFASTTSLYGSSGKDSKEDDPVSPASLYARTKQESEDMVMQRANSISLRWATVFGVSARMRHDLMVNDFVSNAVNDRIIVLYDADSRRTFMHVSDLVRGYVFALENCERMSGEVFNMGSSRLNYTKREIAEYIRALQSCEIMLAKSGDTDVRSFLVNFDKAKSLGYDCTISLDEGIKELIKLYAFYPPNSSVRPI